MAMTRPAARRRLRTVRGNYFRWARNDAHETLLSFETLRTPRMLLIVLIVLAIIFFGGGIGYGYRGGRTGYGHGGLGIGTILIIILIVVLLSGHHF
jgi:hypothetical protein